MSESRNKVNFFHVDAKNQCVDRASEGGKMFEKLQQEANSKAGTGMGQFMNQILAYTEVATVVGNTLPEADADKAIDKLRSQMEETVRS